MRFNLFGFKGELSTTNLKKKKSKEDPDDVIVGGTFRAYSEFGPSSSGTSKPKPQNRPNQTKNGVSNGTKPKAPLVPKVPEPSNPKKQEIAPKITNNSNKKEIAPKITNNSNKKEIAPKITNNSNKKEIAPKITDNSNKKEIEAPKTYEAEIREDPNGKGFLKVGDANNKPEDDSEDEFGAKKVREAPPPMEVQKGSDGRRFVTIGGFDDASNEADDEGEDEFGAKKTNDKAKESSRQSILNHGYSDQAASIFFRNDSPEPDERVRSFNIRKDDNEDATSQTSA